MKLTALTQFLSYFKKKKKENLPTGSLLLIAAFVSLAPGVIHLINGLYSLKFSIFTVDDYISVTIFSILMILPSLILAATAYFLWEEHSLGWKLSIAIFISATLLSFANSAFLYFSIPIALLSGIAAFLETQKLRKGNRKIDSAIVMENTIKIALQLSIFIAIGIVIAMAVFVVVIATPFLSLQFITSMNLNWNNVSRVCYGLKPIGAIGGVLSCTIGSLLVVTFCEFIAVPIGIAAALYLADYSTQGRVLGTIRFFIEALAGAPSIIIALVGVTIFGLTLKWEWSLYSGAIALSFMALPWNIRVAEEAMRQVPPSYKEASFALGATQWQTARLLTLYAAMPGIITGVLLGIGVALGETLVLTWNYTGATLTGLPKHWWHIFSLRQQLPALTPFIFQVPGNTIAASHAVSVLPGANITHVNFLSYSLAMAAGTVLLTIYLILCIGALLLRNHLTKRMKGS